jgi:flagellar hook-associated protein 3 FlgL
MLSNTFLSDLQRNLNNLRKIQQQTASGKNFSKPSDDPFNVVRAMQLQTDINANAQYKTNIVNSLNFMDTTDTALNQIGNVLTGIRENLIKGGNAAYGSDERGKIKDEINQRVSQIAQLLNTNFQGDYIFAGTRGLTKPVMTEDYTMDSSVKAKFGSAEQWNGDITFSITNSSGKATSETVTLSGLTAVNTVDDVINKLNSEIKANSNLVGKIVASKTADGNIKFVSEDNESTIKIENVDGITNEDVLALKENLDGKTADFDPDEWEGTVKLNFNIGGKDVPVSIDCSKLSNPPTIDEVTEALNDAIKGKDDLKDASDNALLEVKNSEGKLEFSINSSDNIKITSASTLSLSALEGREITSESLDSENISIKYLGADGKSLEDIPAVETSNLDLDNWNGQSITFSGTTSDKTNYTGKITLKGSHANVDDLIKDINTQIQKDPNLADRITAVKTEDGNMKFLAVNSRDNIKINGIGSVEVSKTDGIDSDNWNGKSITFDVNGVADDSTKIELSTTNTNVDDLVKDINTQIQGNTNLKDKITAVKTDDGNIKFIAADSGDNIKISSTDVANNELATALDKRLPTEAEDKLLDKQLSSVEMDNIDSKRKAEVSQGVVVEYNACATDILQYGLTSDDNTAALLDRIVHHLGGQIESYTKADGTAYTASDAGVVKDGKGNYYVWDDDESAATSALTNEDLSDIDEASKQLLKVRSEVGAKANRMESMSDQNDDTKINMTEVLSKTEDIDVTEKTIEYYTMITVYQASLQTSARVMQPTLMDYIN